MASVCVVEKGWATKRGATVKNWKRRFLVLRSDGSLSYYTAEVLPSDKTKPRVRFYFWV